MPGRAFPAAHPHTELTTIMSVPDGSVTALSTAAGVRSSWTPRSVSSFRIGSTKNSGEGMRYSTAMKSVAVAVVALLVAAGAQAERRRQPPPPPPGLTPGVPPGVVIPQSPLIPGPVAAPSVGSPFDARPGPYAPRYNDPNSR